MPQTKKKFEKVKVNLIDIGKTQMRNENVKKGLAELAESIRVMGLLEPILLRKVGERYEVVAGQRRFLAVSEILKEDEIDAMVFEGDVDDITASAMSATENIMIEPPATVDYYDICTKLYNHYGTFTAVAKKTGLPSTLVAKYVKYAGLPDAAKKLVDDNIVDVNTAVKARDIVLMTTPEDETMDEEKVVEVAKKMVSMSNSDKTALKKTVAKNPDKPIDEIIDTVDKAPKVKKLTITMLEEDFSRLETLATNLEKTPETTAIDLVLEGLDRNISDDEE